MSSKFFLLYASACSAFSSSSTLFCSTSTKAFLVTLSSSDKRSRSTYKAAATLFFSFSGEASVPDARRASAAFFSAIAAFRDAWHDTTCAFKNLTRDARSVTDFSARCSFKRVTSSRLEPSRHSFRAATDCVSIAASFAVKAWNVSFCVSRGVWNKRARGCVVGLFIPGCFSGLFTKGCFTGDTFSDDDVEVNVGASSRSGVPFAALVLAFVPLGFGSPRNAGVVGASTEWSRRLGAKSDGKVLPTGASPPLKLLRKTSRTGVVASISLRRVSHRQAERESAPVATTGSGGDAICADAFSKPPARVVPLGFRPSIRRLVGGTGRGALPRSGPSVPRKNWDDLTLFSSFKRVISAATPGEASCVRPPGPMTPRAVCFLLFFNTKKARIQI
mmetsp:Transcript_6919/g.26149  ORF Transcript_6919/g.26149 Transcript_6919/m.26149 type:complete len:389 (+) Transcript_6919:805-1971(+)